MEVTYYRIRRIEDCPDTGMKLYLGVRGNNNYWFTEDCERYIVKYDDAPTAEIVAVQAEIGEPYKVESYVKNIKG